LTTRFSSRVFFVLFLAAVASPAAAQRLTLAGQLGTTVQGASAPVFAGEVGIGLLPGASIYGTFGRMNDALPSEVADVFGGLDPIVDVSMPATYGMGGLRIALPAGPIRPYGVGGIGFARFSANVEVFGFDITNLVEDEIGFELSTNQFAWELGGGVMVSLGSNAFLDAGYRYMRVNVADFDISRVYGGLGVRF